MTEKKVELQTTVRTRTELTVPYQDSVYYTFTSRGCVEMVRQCDWWRYQGPVGMILYYQF